MYIADKGRAFGAESIFPLGMLVQRCAEQTLKDRRIGNFVHADINYGRARLHEFVRDHAGASDGGDQDIGAAADRGQIVSFLMADGDGGICIQQQHGGGLADDIAAANDHRFLSSNGNVAAG